MKKLGLFILIIMVHLCHAQKIRGRSNTIKFKGSNIPGTEAPIAVNTSIPATTKQVTIKTEPEKNRILQSVNFLISPGNFLCYFNSKPETIGCDEAIKYRLYPEFQEQEKKDGIKIGVPLRNEVKSIVMEKNGEIYCFTMTGENNLNIKKKFKLEKANLEKYNIIPFTVNPGNIMALADLGVKIHFFMHEDLRKQKFLCNNLGSRVALPVRQSKHRFAALYRKGGSFPAAGLPEGRFIKRA